MRGREKESSGGALFFSPLLNLDFDPKDHKRDLGPIFELGYKAFNLEKEKLK